MSPPTSPPLALAPLSATSSSSSSSSSSNTRSQRRVHVPASILQSLKLATGDFVVLRPSLTAESLGDVQLDQKSQNAPQAPSKQWLLAVAWPSFSQDSNVQLSSHIREEVPSLAFGDYVTIQPMLASGLLGAPVLKMAVTPLDNNYTSASDSKANKASQKLLLAYLKQTLVDLQCVSASQKIITTFQGATRRFALTGFTFDHDRAAADIGLVSNDTQVDILEAPAKSQAEAKQYGDTSESQHQLALANQASYDRIGGLAPQIQLIRELVELPLTRPQLYQHFGMAPPKGLLLYGPPGTGKTLLAHSIAASLGVPAFSIGGASLSSPYHGETEGKLRAIFKEARTKPASVIVLDEVDALAPRREDAGEVERRVVAELLVLMDGLDSKPSQASSSSSSTAEGQPAEAAGQVMVIACTNRPNAIDPALRRPGRFDKEIEIGIPNVEARLDILKVLLSQTPHTLSDGTISSFANRTHGFVGADMASLVHSSCLTAIRRCTANSSLGSTSDMRLIEADIEEAFRTARPSAMREVFLEVPKVHWNDIGGQSDVKQKLKESVEWPLTRKATFERLGFRPPAGVLLYGPPGCSKTLIAKAVATEAGLNFMAVKGPEIFNKFVGESERTIRALFQKARAAAPSVLFLDEIDAIATSRSSDDASTGDRVLTTLLTEMDGMEPLQGVMILAATNRPWSLDSALMRPGRLDRLLYVSPPDKQSREAIYRIETRKMQVDPNLDIDELADLSSGCSGAEIISTCQTAALAAMNEELDPSFIKQVHFARAAIDIRRGITADMLTTFEDWRDQRDS